MGTISFGGLATGMDTDSLISQMMKLEQRPLTRLQTDKGWQSTRLQALGQFNSKLESFLTKIEDLDSATDLQARKATTGSKDFFSATAESTALDGNYQVEVVDLAQVEKEVSQGYADKAAKSFGTGTVSLTVGAADPVAITIGTDNNSLDGLRQAINDADAGVTAAIINDGTDTPYRLVVTGDDVAQNITLDVSGLSGGSYANPSFTETQPGQQAHLRVDGIDIYGDDNTIDGAIPGVTLDLTKAEEGTTTSLTVEKDEEAIKGKIKNFVAGYNAVVSFVTNQSVINGSSGGILKGDSGLNSIKRHLQDMLVEAFGGDGSLKTMSQLGVETQKDGTLKLNDDTLSDAVQNNLGDMAKLLAGDGSNDGIATRFKDYLDGATDSIDGFYAGRKQSIESNLKRIDRSIEMTSARLDQREEALRNQFNALETLVSGLNSQSQYVSQQMSMLNNMWSQ